MKNIMKDSAGRSITHPHNGKLLSDYIFKNKVNRAELARQMDISTTSVYKYAQSYSLQLGILWKASLALKHNFVAELGALLAVDYITPKEEVLQNELKTKQIEIEVLQKQIEHLSIEISVYKSIVGK